DQNRDRRAESCAFEQTGENFGTIRFVPRRRDLALAGSPAIEIALNVLLSESQTRRAAVNDHANAATMRLAEGSDAKEMSEGGSHLCHCKRVGSREQAKFATCPASNVLSSPAARPRTAWPTHNRVSRLGCAQSRQR